MTFRQSLMIAACGAGLTALTDAPVFAEAYPLQGEIRAVSQNWCPHNWARLDGQLIPISNNAALFSLLGNKFGGDAINNFALPDMRGRSMINYGGGIQLPYYVFAEKSGEQTLTLTPVNLPPHTHGVSASSNDPSTNSPDGAALPTIPDPDRDFYTHEPPTTAMMHPGVIAHGGESQPINLYQPYQAVNFCIALEGEYPSRP